MPDGRAGTRNYVAVVAASNCAAHTAELIARSFDGATLPPGVDGVIAFPHGEGCGMSIGPDTRQLQRTLAGILAHPNVGAAIILGLGCEVNQIGGLLREQRLAGRIRDMDIQSMGGTIELHPCYDKAPAGKKGAVLRARYPAPDAFLNIRLGGAA